MRAIAVSSKQRSSSLPNVPTLAESGFPNLSMVVWIAMMSPKGTPQPVLVKLNDGVQANLKTPKFREFLLQLGVEPVEGLGLGKFTAFIAEEIPRWRQIVEESGVEVQ